MKFLLLLALMACSHVRHNHANKHMHKKSHEELLARFEDPRRDLWQKPLKVLEKMGPLKGLSVMDIGSGGGYFTKYFIPRAQKTVAADVDPTFLNFVASRFSDQLQFEARKIQYSDPLMKEGEFDLAFTANTYHHIEERVSYFSKVARGLKTLGRVVIVDFKKDQNAKAFGPPLEMRIKSAQVSEELRAAGLEILTLDEQSLEFQYIIIARKN